MVPGTEPLPTAEGKGDDMISGHNRRRFGSGEAASGAGGKSRYSEDFSVL